MILCDFSTGITSLISFFMPCNVSDMGILEMKLTSTIIIGPNEILSEFVSSQGMKFSHFYLQTQLISEVFDNDPLHI